MKGELLIKKKNLTSKNEVIDIMKYILFTKVEDYVFSNEEINEFIKEITSGQNDPYTISEDILKKFVKEGKLLDN